MVRRSAAYYEYLYRERRFFQQDSCGVLYIRQQRFGVESRRRHSPVARRAPLFCRCFRRGTPQLGQWTGDSINGMERNRVGKHGTFRAFPFTGADGLCLAFAVLLYLRRGNTAIGAGPKRQAQTMERENARAVRQFPDVHCNALSCLYL